MNPITILDQALALTTVHPVLVGIAALLIIGVAQHAIQPRATGRDIFDINARMNDKPTLPSMVLEFVVVGTFTIVIKTVFGVLGLILDISDKLKSNKD